MHDPKEPVLFSDSIIGNYMYEIGFGNFKYENSSFSDNKQQSKILNVTTVQHDSSFKDIVNNVDNYDYVHIVESKVVADSSTWILYFDGSKSKEGAGVGCFLIDPKGNKNCIACRIEFENRTSSFGSCNSITVCFKYISLPILIWLAFPFLGNHKVDQSVVKIAFNCWDQSLLRNIPYASGMSATTISMIWKIEGLLASLIRTSFISPKTLTFVIWSWVIC